MGKWIETPEENWVNLDHFSKVFVYFDEPFWIVIGRYANREEEETLSPTFNSIDECVEFLKNLLYN